MEKKRCLAFLGRVFSHNYNRLESDNRWEIVQVPSLMLLIYSCDFKIIDGQIRSNIEFQSMTFDEFPKMISSLRMSHILISNHYHISRILFYVYRSTSNSFIIAPVRVFDFIKISRLFPSFNVCLFVDFYLEILSRGRSIIKSIIIKRQEENIEIKTPQNMIAERFERATNVVSQEEIFYV